MPAPKSGQESMPRGPFNAHSGAGFGERGVSEVLAALRQSLREVSKVLRVPVKWRPAAFHYY